MATACSVWCDKQSHEGVSRGLQGHQQLHDKAA
jgi:hypothetical protein